MKRACLWVAALVVVQACGLPRRWLDNGDDARLVVTDTVRTVNTTVERRSKPGERPGGAGDCRSILRSARQYHAAAEGAEDVRRCTAPRHAVPVTWAPYTITLSDGREIAAESALLPVPENRASHDSRTIMLTLIRLRSATPTSARPLLFLDGAPDTGPSSSTIRIAPLFPFFDALRSSRDVILMDYRGSGLSTPLMCPQPGEMPLDLYSSRESGLRFFEDQGRACASAARAGDVDILGYTWNEVAADVEAIRQAIGAPQIDLLGFSSGTHAALVTLKRFGDGIGRVVMIGSEGLDHTRKLPSALDRQLARIAKLVSADSALSRDLPDFLGTMRSVLERAERRPYEVSVRVRSGDTVIVPVGRFGLSYFAAKNLSAPGNFDVLTRLFATLEREDLSVLTSMVQRVYGRPGAPNGLIILMDGSAGISGERAARLKNEAASALLGDAGSFPYPEIQSAWGYADMGEAYRAPVSTTVPALFITGALDGNTPPEQADEVRAGFRNSIHLVVENAGHSTPFRVAAVPHAITAFLDGADVSGMRLAAPAVRLAPIPGESVRR